MFLLILAPMGGVAQEIPPISTILGHPENTASESANSPSNESDQSDPSAEASPLRATVAEKEKTPDDIHRTFLQKLKAENRFPTAASCAQCHPDHYDEWSVSPHAYAMMSPVFNSMHAFLVERTSGTTGDFCIRCHTPIGMEQEHDMFGSALLRPTNVVEGVSCIVCHRIDRDFGNISGRFPMKKGPITDAVYGPSGNANLQDAIEGEDFGLVTSKEERGKLVHNKAVRSPVIQRSAQCAMCHDVNSPAGLRLESAFTEYKHSPAAKAGTSCQDCHMSETPGAVLPEEKRYSSSGRDLNYGWGPAARVRNSSIDPREGLPTPDRKRTNHMFIGPDYSIVHPGIFPHSVDAVEFTYSHRFKKVLTKENEKLAEYLRTLSEDIAEEKKKEKEISTLRRASKEARRYALSDWITFRWEEGWGTKEFEEELSESARKVCLQGVGFPWNDEDDPAGARVRRERARLLLDRQFHLLNKAHVERTRILRRGMQLGTFEVTRNDRKGFEFYVDVHNGTDGHAVPTGFDAERVMYLEVTLYDGLGRTLFRSGDRDPNGDIRDLHSAFVHAEAPKQGMWFEASDWKEGVGLPRRKDDYFWRPDPYLFSLQSKFITQNLVGGEREQVLPLAVSFDPLPFIRPPVMAAAHTGRAGPNRKKFRTIPPLGKKRAGYKVSSEQLTGAGPYTIKLRLIAQMVPVNLIKTISPVGFDFNLSAAEVGRLVAFGHKVNSSGVRKGGAVTVWEKTICDIVPESNLPMHLDFRPLEASILDVPVSMYPFPHISKEELAARREALSQIDDIRDFVIQNLGPLRPDLWGESVPDGLPLLPAIDVMIPDRSEDSDATLSGSLFPANRIPPPEFPKEDKKEKENSSEEPMKEQPDAAEEIERIEEVKPGSEKPEGKEKKDLDTEPFPKVKLPRQTKIVARPVQPIE